MNIHVPDTDQLLLAVGRGVGTIVTGRRRRLGDHRGGRVARVGLRAPVHGPRPIVDVLQEQTAGPRRLPGVKHGRYDRIRRRLVVDGGARVRDSGSSDGGGRRRFRRRLDQPAAHTQRSSKRGWVARAQLRLLYSSGGVPKSNFFKTAATVVVVATRVVLQAFQHYAHQQLQVDQLQVDELQIVQERYVVHDCCYNIILS